MHPVGPPFLLEANAAVRTFLRVPLQIPAGGVTPAGDQIHLLFGDGPASLLQIFYLRLDGSTWRTLLNPANAANQPIVGATGMVVLRRVNADRRIAWQFRFDAWLLRGD